MFFVLWTLLIYNKRNINVKSKITLHLLYTCIDVYYVYSKTNDNYMCFINIKTQNDLSNRLNVNFVVRKKYLDYLPNNKSISYLILLKYRNLKYLETIIFITIHNIFDLCIYHKCISWHILFRIIIDCINIIIYFLICICLKKFTIFLYQSVNVIVSCINDYYTYIHVPVHIIYTIHSNVCRYKITCDPFIMISYKYRPINEKERIIYKPCDERIFYLSYYFVHTYLWKLYGIYFVYIISNNMFVYFSTLERLPIIYCSPNQNRMHSFDNG